MKAIGERLRHLEIALGKEKQTELCKLTGIKTNTYSQWRHGTRMPARDLAQKFCKATGITMDWLYTGETRGMPYEIMTAILRAERAEAVEPVSISPETTVVPLKRRKS